MDNRTRIRPAAEYRQGKPLQNNNQQQQQSSNYQPTQHPVMARAESLSVRSQSRPSTANSSRKPMPARQNHNLNNNSAELRDPTPNSAQNNLNLQPNLANSPPLPARARTSGPIVERAH